jgi:hypothetical protein
MELRLGAGSPRPRTRWCPPNPNRPRASARYRYQQVALTCKVGGHPVRTTVSRHVVTATTDHHLTTRGDHHHIVCSTVTTVATHVSAWFGRGEGPPTSGVSPISTSARCGLHDSASPAPHDRRGSINRVADGVSIRIGADHFAIGLGSQRPPDLERQRTLDELNMAIGHQHIGAAGMIAVGVGDI